MTAKPLHIIRTKNLFYSRSAKTTHIWKRMQKYNPRNNKTFIEPDAAYDAFLFYLHSSEANRSKEAVIEHLDIPAGTVRSWYYRWSWRVRALAYDLWIVRQQNAAIVNEKRNEAKERVRMYRFKHIEEAEI